MEVEVLVGFDLVVKCLRLMNGGDGDDDMK